MVSATSTQRLSVRESTLADASARLRPLLLFAYMQTLDVLSTIAFLLGGLQEANPIVRGAMHATGHPVAGLLVIKALALLLGWYCWRAGRLGLLEKANIFFALLVAYNLFCLILALSMR